MLNNETCSANDLVHTGLTSVAENADISLADGLVASSELLQELLILKKN